MDWKCSLFFYLIRSTNEKSLLIITIFLAVIPIASPCWSIHFHYLENNMTWEPTQEHLNCVLFWHNLHLHTLLRSLESITVGMIWLHLLYLKWNRRKWFIKCLFKYDYIPNIIDLLRPPSTPYQLYHIFSTFKFLFPEFIFLFLFWKSFLPCYIFPVISLQRSNYYNDRFIPEIPLSTLCVSS